MKKLSFFLAAVSMLWALSARGGQLQADAGTSTPEAAASQPATPSATAQPVQDNGPLEQGNILIAYFSLWDNAPWEQDGVVFIGYPVWAATLPQAVRTFLSAYDFSGKIVIPFCTHDGYGAGRSFSTVAELADGANMLEDIAIEAADVPGAQDAIAQWLERVGLHEAGKSTQGETAIRITVGDTQLEGVLYDGSMARQFIAQLPQTITMTNYGGREVYGGIEQAITVEGEGQLNFKEGDITYCPANNTAAIFYSQSDHPNLTMTVYPIGKVTSGLSIFPDLPSRVEITFEVISK